MEWSCWLRWRKHLKVVSHSTTSFHKLKHKLTSTISLKYFTSSYTWIIAAYIHILLYHSYLTKNKVCAKFIYTCRKALSPHSWGVILEQPPQSRPRKTKTVLNCTKCQCTHPSRHWTSSLSGLPSTECRSLCQSPPKRCSLPTGKLRGNQTPATQGDKHWIQE